MRTITIEEHFATSRFFDGPGRHLKEQAEKFNNARALKLIPQLCELGDKRIAEMDAAGIDMQIVSLTAPGVEQLEAAEAIALANPSAAVPRAEYPLELFYSYNVRPGWSVRPDFQYIVHPGGFVQAPSVVILGLRTDLEF